VTAAKSSRRINRAGGSRRRHLREAGSQKFPRTVAPKLRVAGVGRMRAPVDIQRPRRVIGIRLVLRHQVPLLLWLPERREPLHMSLSHWVL
jgi:hypothetical protein